jgi:hypothetical protein
MGGLEWLAAFGGCIWQSLAFHLVDIAKAEHPFPKAKQMAENLRHHSIRAPSCRDVHGISPFSHQVAAVPRALPTFTRHMLGLKRGGEAERQRLDGRKAAFEVTGGLVDACSGL